MEAKEDAKVKMDESLINSCINALGYSFEFQPSISFFKRKCDFSSEEVEAELVICASEKAYQSIFFGAAPTMALYNERTKCYKLENYKKHYLCCFKSNPDLSGDIVKPDAKEEFFKKQMNLWKKGDECVTLTELKLFLQQRCTYMHCNEWEHAMYFAVKFVEKNGEPIYREHLCNLVERYGENVFVFPVSLVKDIKGVFFYGDSAETLVDFDEKQWKERRRELRFKGEKYFEENAYSSLNNVYNVYKENGGKIKYIEYIGNCYEIKFTEGRGGDSVSIKTAYKSTPKEMGGEYNKDNENYLSDFKDKFDKIVTAQIIMKGC